MTGTDMGISGCVEWDVDATCFNDDHEPTRLIPTDERSTKGNSILKCPECGTRRAVSGSVVRLKPARDSTDGGGSRAE